MSTPNPLPGSAATAALELDLLRTFVAIVDSGSFRSAADLVLRTPSAVSMQVKKLEEIVGRPVLTRDARAVALTQDGEVLLAYARQLITLSDEALGRFRRPSIEGMVRLGAPDDYGSRFLPSILKRFATTHPGVVVDVCIDQSAALKTRVNEGSLDLALFSCSTDTDAEANVEFIFEEPLVWAGVRGGCAHLSKPVPLAMWDEGCAWRSIAVAALAAAALDYRVAFMSAHSAGQRAAVLADLAIAPFPRSFIEHPLVMLAEQDGLPPLGNYRIGLITRPRAGAAAQAVAAHVRVALAAQAG